uniref:RWD domain-containing protein n=1 Tax=Syphacia muris TaxID=451379 RepID=A0A0N5AWE0_9BILA
MEDNAESDFLEISVLKSIYGDDLVVERTENGRDGGLSVEMKVQPLQMNNCSTASLHIKFLLSDNYPAQPPKILLLQPRGIDDKNLNALNAKLDEYLNNNLGAEVLYDLMQVVTINSRFNGLHVKIRKYKLITEKIECYNCFQLTQTFIEKFQATPSALCPICLCDFSTKQPSLCTSCEHFVHTCCFASYIRYSKAEIEKQLNEWPSDMKYKVDQTLRCPVCRLELNETEYSCELNKEDCEGSKDNEDFDFDWGSWKHLQEELNVIYERQLRNGGIIDLEKEKQKNMVTEDTVCLYR